MIEARLGRGAQDVLEAAVVLEAWGGMRANSALSLGSRVVPPKPPRWTPGRLTTEESGRRESIITEAIALIMAILAVASWAGPLGRQVGTAVLTQAIVIALPTTLALLWAIRSRYLSRRSGFIWLSRDRIVLLAIAILGIEAPLMLLSSYGPLAGMFVAIWVGGTILSRRGWGLFYGLLLVGTVIALQADLPAYPLLLGLTAIILIGAVTAIRTSHERSKEPAGRVGRALWAGAMGAALGGVLVGDSSLGWGVHGAFPALALLPSIFGSFWGGYHLWQFYDAVPRGLQGAGLERANERSARGPAMRVFLGAVGRLLLLTVALSAFVIFDLAVDLGHEQAEPVRWLWLRGAAHDADQRARVAGIRSVGADLGRGRARHRAGRRRRALLLTGAGHGADRGDSGRHPHRAPAAACAAAAPRASARHQPVDPIVLARCSQPARFAAGSPELRAHQAPARRRSLGAASR